MPVPADFIVVSAKEYERLVVRDMVRDAEKMLDHPEEHEWFDADEVLGQLRKERIAVARQRRGWSQRTLASKAKMPQSQLSRIERNPDSTTLRQLKRIAEALGVPVADLV